MANQLNIQAVLSCQGGALVAQGSGSQAPSQASSSGKSVAVVRSPSGSNAVLTTSEIATGSRYWVFIRNIDATNVLTAAVGPNSGSVQNFATLNAGDFCLIPVPASQLVFVTGSGSNNVQVVGVEP